MHSLLLLLFEYLQVNKRSIRSFATCNSSRATKRNKTNPSLALRPSAHTPTHIIFVFILASRAQTVHFVCKTRNFAKQISTHMCDHDKVLFVDFLRSKLTNHTKGRYIHTYQVYMCEFMCSLCETSSLVRFFCFCVFFSSFFSVWIGLWSSGVAHASPTRLCHPHFGATCTFFPRRGKNAFFPIRAEKRPLREGASEARLCVHTRAANEGLEKNASLGKKI